VVTGVKAGKAIIRLTVSGTKLTASCSVTVIAPGGGATAITLSKAALSVPLGKTSTLAVGYLPTTAKGRGVTWKCSDESIARVSPTGIVTGIAAGKATVTAICDLTGVTAKCEVTVTIPVASVTLSAAALSLKVGAAAALTYTINPENATNQEVTWKSSNPKIVAVDAKGNLTALAAGIVTITITTEDGKKTAICKVTVTK